MLNYMITPMRNETSSKSPYFYKITRETHHNPLFQRQQMNEPFIKEQMNYNEITAIKRVNT